MEPEVALLPLSAYAELLQIKRVSARTVVSVEQPHHIITAGHPAEPYFIVAVAELVGERFAHETVGVKFEHFRVGIESDIVADSVILVGDSHRASGHELQRNDSLLFSVGLEFVQTNEVTIKNHLVATGDT